MNGVVTMVRPVNRGGVVRIGTERARLLYPAEAEKLRRRLMKTACGPAVVDALFRQLNERGPDGDDIVRFFYTPEPQADSANCRKVCCQVCGRATPINVVVRRVVVNKGRTVSVLCLDCAISPTEMLGWGPSMHARTMQRFRLLNKSAARRAVRMMFN